MEYSDVISVFERGGKSFDRPIIQLKKLLTPIVKLLIPITILPQYKLCSFKMLCLVSYTQIIHFFGGEGVNNDEKCLWRDT